MRDRIRRLLRRAGDELVDRWLGIRTTGLVTYDQLEFDEGSGDNPYQGTNWLALLWLHHVLRHFGPTPDGSFIDFGAGKGRVVALAARFPFRAALGVELSPSLARTARENLQRGRAPRHGADADVVEGDMGTFPIPDDLAIAFIYNTSQGPAFTAAVEAIRASLEKNPRRFLLLYINPALHDQLLDMGFRLVRRARVVNARAYAYAPAG